MRVRTEARRDAILAAATILFQKMGYERASMNELAKRLGGSKATLYGYFPSKEALFVAVVRMSSTAHLSAAIEDLQHQTARDTSLQSTLQRFAERMLLVLTNETGAVAVYRMVIAEAGHSDVGELFNEAGPKEALTALAGLFTLAIARGELRKADPALLATQFTSLATAETTHRLLQRNPAPLSVPQIRKMATRAVDMFLGGAAP